MWSSTLPFALALALASTWCSSAVAKRKRQPLPKRYHIGKHREYLRAYADSKGHYFIVTDFIRALRTRSRTRLVFYGTAKRLFRQRVTGASRNGQRFSYTVYDPRMRYPNNSYFLTSPRQSYFQCVKRRTALRELGDKARERLLTHAKLYDLYWKRTAHALMRDDDGVYYYVDKLWVPRGTHGDPFGTDDRGFRVFIGKRGRLKRLRMKNIVNDPQGQIFITTKGKLKLIIGQSPAWIAHGKRTKLTRIDLRRSTVGRVLIYRQLGVYRGQRLEKPCDDL